MAKQNEHTNSELAGTNHIDPIDAIEPSESTSEPDGSPIISTESDNSDPGSSTGESESEAGIGNPAAGVNTRARKRSAGSSNDNGTSGKSRQKTSRPVDLNKPAEKIFAQQLVGIHKIIGIVTRQPDLWMITNEQGAALSDAILEVMNQYKIKPNPKMVAWGNLIGVCSIVYGTKVIMYKAIVAQRKRSMHQQPQQQRENPPAENSGGFKMQFN
jgi:hypothetical protein